MSALKPAGLVNRVEETPFSQKVNNWPTKRILILIASVFLLLIIFLIGLISTNKGVWEILRPETAQRTVEISDNSQDSVKRSEVNEPLLPSSIPQIASLPDLIIQTISFDKDPYPTYQADDTVTVNVVVQNIGTIDATNVNVRFFADLPFIPDCSTPSISAQTNLSSVAPNNGTAKWGPFTFSVPAVRGTRQVWALIGCGTEQSNRENDFAQKTYYISGLGAWFETTGGDVGSRGLIRVGKIIPNERRQSDYVLVANTLDDSVKTARWKLNKYAKNLVPAGTAYNFFASRFLRKARLNGGNCSIKSGITGLVYCDSDIIYSGSSAPAGDSVWFVRGNLVISQNLVIGGADTAVFVVSGNITIETNVTRADGVYIAGSKFADFGGQSSQGRQLTINGAIYAKSVDLSRTLGGSTCKSGIICDNSQTSALVMNYQPKYLIQLISLLGSPSIVWKEVEP